MTPAEQTEFKAWLARQGAELRTPTNPYEVVRFVAKGGTHVVYQNGRGTIKVSGIAREAYDAWRSGARWDAGIAKVARHSMAKARAALVERDGRACFYCGQDMPNDDMTVEHLVSRDKGGPNHMDNLALVHERCNREADNLPLVEKIRLHCRRHQS